jgi:hypothetical protein
MTSRGLATLHGNARVKPSRRAKPKVVPSHYQLRVLRLWQWQTPAAVRLRGVWWRVFGCAKDSTRVKRWMNWWRFSSDLGSVWSKVTSLTLNRVSYKCRFTGNTRQLMPMQMSPSKRRELIVARSHSAQLLFVLEDARRYILPQSTLRVSDGRHSWKSWRVKWRAIVVAIPPVPAFGTAVPSKVFNQSFIQSAWCIHCRILTSTLRGATVGCHLLSVTVRTAKQWTLPSTHATGQSAVSLKLRVTHRQTII